MVEVKGYPQVDLGPMSASIRKGEQVSIKCISPDDSWQEFTYDWFKVHIWFPLLIMVANHFSYSNYSC